MIVQLVEDTDWRVGKPGNGTNWQCPESCLFLSSGNYSVPGGENVHIRVGKGAMNSPAGVNGFHNSIDAVLYTDKIRVVNRKDRYSNQANLLRIIGETAESEGETAMFVRRFDKASSWGGGKKVFLQSYFKPVPGNYDMRFNIELRGDNVNVPTEPQVLSVFLSELPYSSFVQYRKNFGASKKEAIEKSFLSGFDFCKGEWHEINIMLTALDTENAWKARVRVLTDDKVCVNWESFTDIVGAKAITTYSVGDERHSDRLGGVFLWEPIKVYEVTEE